MLDILQNEHFSLVVTKTNREFSLFLTELDKTISFSNWIVYLIVHKVIYMNDPSQ